MVLTIDLGNTNIAFALFKDGVMILSFRKITSEFTPDELLIFLNNILSLNSFDIKDIKHVICSCVVSKLKFAVEKCINSYLNLELKFIDIGDINGTIFADNPEEVGQDLLADVLGASFLYPDSNLIVVDMGTITKFIAVSKNGDFLGTSFMPGIDLQMKSMYLSTSKLSSVEIKKPTKEYGNNTYEALNTGLYYGHIGSIKQIVNNFNKNFFDNTAKIIGTGGYSLIYQNDNIFDEISFNLLHYGLYSICKNKT